MSVSQFSLLIQAAGTALLLFLFILLYQKILRPAFLDWIASWAFLLAGLIVLLLAGEVGLERSLLVLLNFNLVAHAVCLLRGAHDFRREKTSRGRPLQDLWALPLLALPALR